MPLLKKTPYEIRASYKQLGGSFASFYDGIITRSTLSGKLADRVVWGLHPGGF